MNWFHERKSIDSQKNGILRIERLFGKTTVRAYDRQYTSPGLSDIWTRSFKKIRPHLTDKGALRILHVGFAAGGTVKETYEEFPGCTIEAIEYDPDMITLAQELKLWEPFPAPVIHCRDAEAFLISSTNLYDLILVDIFVENLPSSLLLEDSFAELLRNHLKPAGVVLINALHDEKYLVAAHNALTHIGTWFLISNFIGAFQRPEKQNP